MTQHLEALYFEHLLNNTYLSHDLTYPILFSLDVILYMISSCLDSHYLKILTHNISKVLDNIGLVTFQYVNNML